MGVIFEQRCVMKVFHMSVLVPMTMFSYSMPCAACGKAYVLDYIFLLCFAVDSHVIIYSAFLVWCAW